MVRIPRAAMLGAALLAGASSLSAHAALLSLADVESSYSVFTLANASINNSSIGGRAAFGGDAFISGFSIGGAAPGSATYSLVTGGSLLFQNGSVSNGRIAYGNTLTISAAGYSGADQRSDVIDFATTMNGLRAYSAQIAGAAATGSVSGIGTLTLTGANASYNVFSLTAAQLAGASSLALSAPAGSKIFINVSGANASLANFGFSGFSAANTLFNFSETNALSLSAIGVVGTILAPYADVVFENGDLQGQLFANNLYGGAGGVGSIGSDVFSGYGLSIGPSPVPEPSTYALMLAGIAMLGGIVGRRRRQPV